MKKIKNFISRQDHIMKIEKIVKIEGVYHVSGWAKSSLFEIKHKNQYESIETYKRDDLEANRFFGFFFSIAESRIEEAYFIGDGIEVKISDLILKNDYKASQVPIDEKIKTYFNRVLSKGKSNVKSLIISRRFLNPINVIKGFVTSFYDFGYLKSGFAFIKQDVDLKKEISNKYIIAIPIYNGFKHVKKCLESVDLYTDKNIFEIWLLNDASTEEGLKDYLDSYSYKRGFKVFHNDSNLGFVKNCNFAFDEIRKTDQNLVLLNADTEVFSNSIENLAKACDQLNAIVSPLTNSGSICSFPNPHSDKNIILSSELISNINNIEISEAYRVPVVVGFCMAIPNHAIKKLKGFDEIFGRGYGEEVDFSMRGNEQNIYSYLFYGSYVYHFHGASFGKEEKALLNKKNNKILTDIYPTFLKLIQTYFATEILKRNAFKYMLKILPKEKVIYSLNQPNGGGASSYLEDYSLVNNKAIASIEPINKELTKICMYTEYNSDPTAYTLDFDSANRLFVDIFNKSSAKKTLFINHLISSFENKNLIYDHLIDKSDDVVYLWHDHFAISPNYTLFCESKSGACYGCKKCSDSLLDIYDIESLEQWRNRFKLIFDRVHKLIFFSNDSLSHFKNVYTDYNKKIKVRPHKLSHDTQKELVEDELEKISIINNRSRRFKHKILVLGGINKAKGSDAMQSLISPLKLLDACIVHLGDIDNKTMFFNSNYIAFGRYRRKALKELLSSIEFDIGFIPSVWPETFNYTANEISEYSNSKFCSFDIGAVPERFKNNKKYIKLNLDEYYEDPYQIAKKIIMNIDGT